MSMKKFLLMLLAGMLLLASCGETVETVSEGDESKPEEQGGPYHTLVSYGKPYTLNRDPNESYPDKFGAQLTDGQKTPLDGAHYSDSRMVGFTSNVIIQIDLGEEDGKRIKEIVARSLEMHQDGVGLAGSVRFSGSNDGKKFESLGNRPFRPNGDLTVSEARLELDGTKDYRYIRAQFFKGDSVFIFMDEIEVYADVAPKKTEDLVAAAYAEENIDRNAWQAVSTGVEANPVDTEIITVGAKYSFADCGFDERAPKEDLLLTDGNRTLQYFSDPVWVGLTSDGSKAPRVDLTLDSVRKDIYSFKVYALGGGVNVDLPAYIDVYSTKGQEKTFLGRMYGSDKRDNFVYTLLLPEYIEAKNISFEFPKREGNYWIEEIQVIAGHNELHSDVLYPPLDFEKVTEDILWDESESDYSDYQNLLLGKLQQVSALFYADLDHHGDESPADFPYLTDGKRAKDTYCYNGEWFFSRGSDGIEFFFDLGRLSSINAVNISLLEHNEWGISRPKFISVFLSDDGENWYEINEYSRGDSPVLNQQATRLEIPIEFDKYYAARFVRFRVEGGFTFIDELEAFGTKKVDSKTVRLAESGIKSVPFYTNPESEQFATIENTPLNASDIIIVYGDRNLEEDLLPMVAYLDEDGNIKDTFMDGFLYCSHTNLPSGSLAHLPNYKIDWEYSFDRTFNGAAGFDALDRTVGQVKEALGLTDYKVKVYNSFLTLRQEVTDFGDVDGDGISEDASTVEGRKKIFDWYIKLNMDEFEKRNYQNIEFDGFYWINEAVVWEKDDSHVITEAGDAVHAAGTNFLWVPYFEAYRYYTGYEMNFDAICMQPNVVFTTDAPYWRFEHSASAVKARKMCIEIEHSYQCISDPSFARSYMLYLYYGVKTGYMDSIHVYYDDVSNFAKLARSKASLARLQYDATYDFVKRKLDITPDKREKVSVKGSKNAVISASLENDGLALFTLATNVKNGYIAFNSDGSFRYFPDKDFSGTDSFTYTYNNFLGESEECVVEIIVE
ncbi:MAG: DUF4855 domain-containing protein [Ruminococcaceae bacterium]|nr:DUF4855 domain-containing protein [Oscillospiraceae bacterium]